MLIREFKSANILLPRTRGSNFPKHVVHTLFIPVFTIIHDSRGTMQEPRKQPVSLLIYPEETLNFHNHPSNPPSHSTSATSADLEIEEEERRPLLVEFQEGIAAIKRKSRSKRNESSVEDGHG